MTGKQFAAAVVALFVAMVLIALTLVTTLGVVYAVGSPQRTGLGTMIAILGGCAVAWGAVILGVRRYVRGQNRKASTGD